MSSKAQVQTHMGAASGALGSEFCVPNPIVAPVPYEVPAQRVERLASSTFGGFLVKMRE
jgi:hypothetical protein